MQPAVVLMVFSHMYNELDGAQEHWFIRNVLNACGLSCFSVGSAVVATGFSHYSITDSVYTWVGLLAAVITTTVQVQDLPDVEGDRARGRKTMLLMYGDKVTRWSIAVLVVFWSVACCWYWELSYLSYVPGVAVAALMAWRVLLRRKLDEDEVTWKLWCVWMMVLYMLPLFKRLEGSSILEALA